MVDWLHCNTCFIQPGPVSDGHIFFLTSCGHVFCDKCQDKGWKQKCLFCGTATPSTIKLTSKLTPPVDAYFADPRKMMQQLFSDMKQLIATHQFQDDQRKRLMKWLTNHATGNAEQEKEKLKLLERENCKLRQENGYLKKLLDEKSTAVNYFKRLLSEKNPGNSLRSPSCDMNRVFSPVNRAFGRTPSPVAHHPYNQNMSRNSPGSGCAVTPGRVSVRLPPSAGRLGSIPSPQNRTPTSKEYSYTPVSKEYSYTATH